MKLRFNLNEIAYELEGSVPEFVEFIRSASEGELDFVPAEQHEPDSAPKELPTPREVAQFIENLGDADLKHTMPQITQHFLGRTLDTRKEILLYNQMFARLQKARRYLESKARRKFEGVRQPVNGSKRGGGTMVYSLKPSIKHLTPPSVIHITSEHPPKGITVIK